MSAFIRARIEEPATVARTGWPVTHGCPFPQGALKRADQVRLIQEDGGELPLFEREGLLEAWRDEV